MTEEQLQAIEARAEAATPGPWRAAPSARSGDEVVVAEGYITVAYLSGRPVGERDARFIAAARADVPALVAEVRRSTRLAAAEAALRVARAEHAATERNGRAVIAAVADLRALAVEVE